jgi:phosphatidylinositol glycan class T
MDGIFTTTITNNSPTSQRATYSEIWPWWVKGWISELEVKVKSNGNGNGTLDQSVNKQELITHLAYHPSTPPKPTTTTLHLSLILPADSTIVMTIPFTKLMLKYTEHRPDAERGREISSGILTLFNDDHDVDKGYRKRIYTPRLLLDVPTPDFSMPYNVIIMSSTVMAVFFGLMHGSLTRRWGWVELPDAKGESGELRKKECKGIEK